MQGGCMDPDLLITSLQNQKVKDTVRLRERGVREKTQMFLIEGYRELLRAFENGHPVETLFVCESLFLGVNEPKLISQLKNKGATILFCSEPVFKKLSYRDRPDGLLAVAPQQHRTLSSFHVDPKRPVLFIVAEAIEKPGNLGTILRSADAAGVDGIILCDRCTDIHNPNVVRASVGTLFTVPVFEATSEEALMWLKDNNIAILAATPSASVSFTEANLQGSVAIAVGTEQLGLTKNWMEKADIQVKIPMHGLADSLNVAMATCLLLFEARRQRT